MPAPIRVGGGFSVATGLQALPLLLSFWSAFPTLTHRERVRRLNKCNCTYCAAAAAGRTKEMT